jgi:signal transduction histidine kinase
MNPTGIDANLLARADATKRPIVPVESGIETLTRFARLASAAGTGSDILPLLADSLVLHTAADAVAVVEIREGGAKFAPSPHLPEELLTFEIDSDMIGAELDGHLLAACRRRFGHVRPRPLVSGGGLFGWVVMFFRAPDSYHDLRLADGLVDMAAVTLANAAKLHQLALSHAELRASNETLARTEKLRALGQMAAGVSHDLKNILNPLWLQLQLVERAIDSRKIADAKETTASMKQVLARGVQTIERLREYSRQSPETRTEDIDLNRLVHEASEIARPRMASRGGRMNRIQEELGAIPLVAGRSGEIVSALVNLIVNAIDAMPGGGTIVLRTGESDGGSWVEVADDGPGMPPEVARRVFEPFFTTKGEEGTGLGLAMVYACMQRYGGSVTVESEVGKGTTFRLWFRRIASVLPQGPLGDATASIVRLSGRAKSPSPSSSAGVPRDLPPRGRAAQGRRV